MIRRYEFKRTKKSNQLNVRKHRFDYLNNANIVIRKNNRDFQIIENFHRNVDK